MLADCVVVGCVSVLGALSDLFSIVDSVGLVAAAVESVNTLSAGSVVVLSPDTTSVESYTGDGVIVRP